MVMDGKAYKPVNSANFKGNNMETELIHGYNVTPLIPYNKAMPLLRRDIEKDGKVLSIRDLMYDAVTAHENKEYEKRDFLLAKNLFIDASTSCPYYNNTFGVIHNSKSLLEVDEDTTLMNSVIPKTIEEYILLARDNSEYFLSRSEEGLILDTNLEEEQALDSRVWFLFAGRDPILHKSFVKMRFSLSPKGSKLMGVYLPEDRPYPAERAWYLGNLDSGSGANAGVDGDEDISRLLGVRTQNLEKVLEK